MGQDEQHYRGEQGDEDVRNLLDRVHTLLCQLKYEEALPLAQRAVELAPRNLEAWRELGSTYGDLGRVAELEQAFEQALCLAVTPEEEAETWYYRGHAENDADAWDAAVRSFERVAELEPESYFPWFMQGMVLNNMGAFVDRLYFEKALIALERALTLVRPISSDKRRVYGLMAWSLFGLNRVEEAHHYQHKSEGLW